MKKNDEMVNRAIEAIRETTGFEPGAEIKTEALHAALGIKEPEREPGESDRRFAKRCKRAGLASVGPVESLRERLLVTHQVDLRATGRGSYRVTPPGVQAAIAERDGVTGARRALKSSLRRIQHVNLSRLTPEQKADRDRAMLNTSQRVAMLSGRTVSRVLDDAAKSAEKEKSEPRTSMPVTRKGVRPEG